MFRALLCSSSGGQNCIIQHLLSSHSVGGRPVHRWTFVIVSRRIILRIRNVSDKSGRRNRNTRCMFMNFFRKSFRLWDDFKKYGGTRQATVYNIIRRRKHAIWLPDNYGKHTYIHTHTHIKFYTCLPTAIIVMWTRLFVASYVHCFYCCSFTLLSSQNSEILSNLMYKGS